MRVLICGKGWFGESPGGLDRYALDLTRALRKQGVGVDGVVVGSPDLDQGFVGTSTPDAPLLRRLCSTAVEGRARSRAADVINGHFALYTLPVLWTRPSRPLAVHFQGPWHREAAMESAQPSWSTALRKYVELSVYRRANEVIVLSGAFRRIVIDEFGILPSRVHVVRPGVDLEHFRPIDQVEAREQLRLPSKERVVLAVRRLTKRVGLDVLLRAWAELKPENAALYLVGDGTERGRLQQLAAELRVKETVHFVGAVSDDELPFWYAAADLSIAPSIALEGFGLVVLESLASGTPVIASNTGGMAEVLLNLSKDLLVPPGDVLELAAVLSDALQTDNQLPSPESCRKFAENFQWKKSAIEVREIFQQALSHPPDRKYRVVFVDHCAKLSGGELALLRLLDGSTSIEPHVIVGEDGPLVQYLRDAGVSTEVVSLPGGLADLSRVELHSISGLLRGATATAKYVAKLTRRLRRLHPDLVHTNSLKSGLYGSLAARAAGIPVVWHLRDRLSEDSYPRSQAVVLRQCVRRMADAVIANSTATAELLNAGSAPVWVIPSPVDITPTTKSEDGRFIVGMVGRLAPWKGQHVFLDAMKHIRKKCPTVRARIVGEPLFGEQKYSESLRRQANELGIADIVDFLGFRHNMAEELAQLTVAVHASIIPEPFGQTVVESMACGVPIVASNAGGPAEVVTNGVDGILVPPGDANLLADAVAQLLEDLDLRVRLGRAGMVKAQRYRPERVAAEVEAVYASVIRTRKAVRD
jgi:glycosyltransferase involved in cell wall biosynthesis